MKQHTLTAITALGLLMTSIAATAQSRSLMPPALQEGDKIAICSPSYKVSNADVENARQVLTEQGWEVVVMPHALSQSGPYAGTDSERLADLKAALTDPDIKAIICSRGGYGAVHLLQQLDSIVDYIQPKWLVGFSDITALHALLDRHGIMSIHGPMANTIHSNAESTERLIEALRGNIQDINTTHHPLNRRGVARGKLIGGNFAVLAHLVGTPYDMVQPGTILFIEDLDEPIYKIERVLWQLRLNGTLGKLAGLIVGNFHGYENFDRYTSMESMISRMVAPYDYPVVFGAPTGHTRLNHPLIESAEIQLTVTPDEGGEIKYLIDTTNSILQD